MYVCVGYDSSKEKKRLQNIMSFGSEVEERKVASCSPVQKDEPEVDRFEEGMLAVYRVSTGQVSMSWV